MADYQDTTWPDRFPAPMRGGLTITPAEDDILRSSNSELSTQGVNPLQKCFKIDIKWQFVGKKFAVFEGWYKHYLWNGIRGCHMTLDGRNFIVFFSSGYSAKASDAYAIHTVSATLDAVELNG